MAVEVVPLTEADIPGAIQVIQEAFADDPYFHWVFDASRVWMSLFLQVRRLYDDKPENEVNITLPVTWSTN